MFVNPLEPAHPSAMSQETFLSIDKSNFSDFSIELQCHAFSAKVIWKSPNFIRRRSMKLKLRYENSGSLIGNHLHGKWLQVVCKAETKGWARQSFDCGQKSLFYANESEKVGATRTENNLGTIEAFRCKCKLRLRAGFPNIDDDNDGFSKLYVNRRTGMDFIAAASFDKQGESQQL